MTHNRCIIFGGGGFIGSHLAEELLNQNYSVIVYSHKSYTTLSNLSGIMRKIKFVEGDLNNEAYIKDVLKSDDFIFDLISSSVPSSSISSPFGEINSHVLPHLRLIKSACEKKVGKIIFVSSGGGIYGNVKKLPIPEHTLPQPISPHAIGKITIEYYLNYFAGLYDMPYLIYRLGNVYGPRQKLKTGFGIVPTLFLNVSRNRRPVLFDHGNLIRDFIYIDDVVEAIIVSFNKINHSHIYNIGTGTKTSLRYLWNTIAKITRTKINPIYKPKRLFDIEKNVLDISLFSTEYQWSPKISIDTGLRKTWKWINNKN